MARLALLLKDRRDVLREGRLSRHFGRRDGRRAKTQNETERRNAEKPGRLRHRNSLDDRITVFRRAGKTRGTPAQL